MTISAFAQTIVVPPVPEPEYADTEVSTNIAVVVSANHAQDIGMTFALHGESVSNCLQVAFGRDSDGDGILGAAVFTGLPAAAQGWPCRHGWDTMRVTRRGPGVPDEWFRCDVRPHFFAIRLM